MPLEASLLWHFGPEGYKQATIGFAERPTLVRMLAVAEIADGLWLALRQYQQ